MSDRPSSSRERPLGVAEVVRLAGRALDELGLVWLEGEVTQVTAAGSGHLYFALSERGCVLSAVMWGRDASRMRFAISAGQRLRVRGRLGVYDRDGKMQLYADFAEPAGAGADALALEQLKARLAAEGIFAAARKRPLPRFPRRIGVVTSARGAAVHDIIRTVQRRLPTPILIADAAVQGQTAPHQIVQGMAMVVRAGVDVVIVGRGGGAATDLTAFNHERVVRTIARCPVPVISAVGHEVDLSLADLAADARASTPTAAAELAVPDGAALRDVLDKERRRLDRELRHRLDRAHQDLDRASLGLHARGERTLALTAAQLHQLQRRLAELHPQARIAARRAALGELERRLAGAQLGSRVSRARAEHAALVARRDAAMRRVLERRRAELGRLGAQIAALSPLAVLDRGYAMVQRDGTLLRDAADAAPGDRLRIRLARGSLAVTIDEVDRGGRAVIRGTTRLAAVIGWPIEHSRSPQMLNAAFATVGLDAVMVPVGVPPADFARAVAGLRAMRALGASVTLPHKLAAAALCDELTAAARSIGAVNCLQLDGDRVIGHNTDSDGFRDGLAVAGFAPRSARAVLLGAGGAARAVAYGLRALGAIEVIARRHDQVTWARAWPWTADQLRESFARADLVVDCTSAALGEHEAAFVDELPLDALRPEVWVASLVYHRTPLLLERARSRGHSTVDGRAMLVHQGARAFTIWTGAPAPIDAMTRALDDALR